VSPPSVRSRVVERFPRLWALWAASRPSQVALVGHVYLLGVGMSTAGAPLVAESATASTAADALGPGFASSVLAGGLALLPVTVAVHYANEYADADTDALTDRTPFSGGSGALVRTGLAPSLLRRATLGACVVAALSIVAVTATGLVPSVATGLLVAALVAGLAYSLAPLALVRRGVGELVNATLGGVLLPVYGVAVVATPTATTALATLPFASVVGCNLLATHWPDRRADEAVGKRTLAVRWSPGRIRRAYAALAVTVVAATAALWWGGVFPVPVAVAHLLAVPLVLRGWAVLTRRRDPLPSVLAMVVTALAATVAWWAVGLGVVS
jgi:1,4-dihydroxy-2-naphthoate octaprenyltransferase